MPNGNILLAGGTKRYDPFYGLNQLRVRLDQQALRAAAAHGRGGRWYPGATQLGNGDVFVLSGLNGAGALHTQPEIYHPATDLERHALSAERAHLSPHAAHRRRRLFFTGVAFGGSAVRVGFLRPAPAASSR